MLLFELMDLQQINAATGTSTSTAIDVDIIQLFSTFIQQYVVIHVCSLGSVGSILESNLVHIHEHILFYELVLYTYISADM